MNIIQYNNDNNDAIKSINKETWVVNYRNELFPVQWESIKKGIELNISVGYINQIVSIVMFFR